MQNNQPLPSGFITVEDAIALIQKDRRDDATVDLQFLVNNIPYLQTKRTYGIRLMKTVEDEKTKRRKAVRAGTSYVTLQTDYDKQVLLRAITDAYKERTNIALSEDSFGVNHVTTMIDQETGTTSGQPRVTTAQLTKAGDDISRPYEKVINEG